MDERDLMVNKIRQLEHDLYGIAEERELEYD